MNCKCIEKEEKRILKGNLRSHPNKKILSVDIEASIITNMETGKMRAGTKSKVLIKVEGIKRPISTFIIHEFCPFCGKKHNL